MNPTPRVQFPHQPQATRFPGAAFARAMAGMVAAVVLAGPADAETPAPLTAVDRLEVARYMGTWYQVAWFPNRFQRQCASDTQARYRLRDDGRVEVLNQCRRSDGQVDSAQGLARPTGRLADGVLEPAQLEVSFLPAALRWTGIGWGRYWVLDLAPDYRYALIGEPGREYLWVLSRTPSLAPADRDRLRNRVQELGFDLSRWVDHPQNHNQSAVPRPTP